MLLCLWFSLFLTLGIAQEGKKTNEIPPQEILPDPAKKEVDSLLKLVRSEYYKKNYDKTLEIGSETLKLAEKIDHPKAIAKIHSLMGNAFLQIEDTIQAQRIFEKNLALSEQRKDSENILTARIDLANMYASQKKIAPAISFNTQALALAQAFKDTVYLFILNHNLAEMNLEQGNLDRSKEHIEQMNVYVKKLKAKQYHAGAHLLTGRYYFLRKMPVQAIENFKKSLEFSEEADFKDGLILSYEYYAKSEAMRGNYKHAYDLQEKANEYRNEKYQTDKIEAIEMVTARFKLNQYEQELRAAQLESDFNEQRTKRETTVFWARIASGILLIFFIFIFITYRKRRRLVKDLLIKNKQYLEEKEKTEELSQAKTKLFSTISHELRTPMYGIIGISSILLEDDRLKPQQENMRSLKFAAEYLLSLINNVLQLNKLDNGPDQSLTENLFNIRNLVNNVVRSSEFISVNSPNQFHVEIDPNVPKYLMGDRVKIAQLLINLVGNSAKFTENGHITVKVERREDKDERCCLYFTVRDTGIGISPEIQKTMFNEFQEHNTKGANRGAGLGLPIVKKILNLYHSNLIVKSEVGKGTSMEFELCFKLATNVPPEEEEAEDKTEKETDGAPKHILVVDDNKLNLLVTQKRLTKLGFSSKVASGGKEAIDMLKQENFHLVLMDINMPEMNGFETTKHIRAFNPTVPVIALTAVELHEIKENIQESGMDDFIIKPYEESCFLEKLNKHLYSM